MKYAKYIWVILKKLFVYKAGIYIAPITAVYGLIAGNYWVIGAAVGLYGWIALAFVLRGYTRNAVYNYVLDNGIWLPRLLDRFPVRSGDIWLLADIHKVSERNTLDVGGCIKYRKVSTVEYWFARALWKWVDDDSNHDTMDGKDRSDEGMIYGNTFDLGDTRAEYPQWKWKESLAWFIRNTGYNSNYMDEECAEGASKYFYNRVTTKWFDWHFGYIPYTNSERQGRLVWFTEDIDRID